MYGAERANQAINVQAESHSHPTKVERSMRSVLDLRQDGQNAPSMSVFREKRRAGGTTCMGFRA